jgi:segregation and condensation protein A
VVPRGTPEAIDIPTAPAFQATLYDLLSAYARQTQKHARAHVRMKPREVWSLADAREALTRLIGRMADWTDLDAWLIAFGVEPKMRRSARASSFSASLELVREGLIELRQEEAFAPLYMRAVVAAPDDAAA